MRSVFYFPFAALLLAGPSAEANTNWTLTLATSGSVFTATETTNSTTMSGSFSRPGTGYTLLTVAASAGAEAPAPSSVFSAIEIPGLAMMVQPMNTNELAMVNLVTSGSCPTQSQNEIFVFTQWDSSGGNDMTNPYQPVFGTFSFTPPGTGTVTNVYNSYGERITNFSAFNLSGTCASGQMPVAGAGDRGGTLYMSSQGGGFWRTNGNKGVFVIPQVQLPTPTLLSGNYSLFRYVNGMFGTTGTNGNNGSVTLQTIRATVNTWATSATGNTVNPATNANTGTNVTFTISQVNSPVNGFLRGTLVENSASADFTCAVYLTSQNVLFCAGQTPGDAKTPLNILMVSDATVFSQRTNMANGQVSSVVAALDAANLGKFYIGGSFTSYQGTSISHLARVYSDGTLDTSFNPGTGPNSTIYQLLAASDSSQLGQVYVAGSFSTYAGTSVYGVIRINSDGSRDANFTSPNFKFGASPTTIQSLAIPPEFPTRLYVAGDFNNSYTGGSQPYLTRLLSNGARDATFGCSDGAATTCFADPVDGNPEAFTVVPDAAHPGRLYVGGELTSYAGKTIGNIARLFTNGARDTSFNYSQTGGFDSPTFGFANGIGVDAGKLYVGGNFFFYTNANGTTNSGFLFYQARLLSDGTLDSAFGPQGNNFPVDIELVVADPVNVGKVYYSDINNHFWRDNSDGTLDTSFGQSGLISGIVSSIASVPGSTDMVIGGSFNAIGNYGATNFARITTGGNLIQGAFNVPSAGPNGTINAMLAATDATNLGRLYIAGGFTSLSMVTYSGLVRLNASGTIDNSFAYNSSIDTGTAINALALGIDSVNLNKVYIGGSFYSVSGAPGTTYIARLTNAGALDTTFATTGSGLTGGSSGVQSIAAAQDSVNLGKVYIAGDFTGYDTVTIGYLYRLLTNGAYDASFNSGTGFNNAVNVVTAAPAAPFLGDIYVGGIFTSYNGATAYSLTRLLSNGTIDTNFIAEGPSDFIGTSVNAIAVATDPTYVNDIYVGGNFSKINSSNRVSIARLFTNGKVDASFKNTGTGFNGTINWIAPAQDSANLGKIYVGGTFTVYNTTSIRCIARLLTTGALDATFAPVGTGIDPTCSVSSVVPAIDPLQTGNVYVGGSFNSYNQSSYGNNLLRMLTNGNID